VTPSSHGERARRAGRYDELSQRLPSDSPRCSAASELLVRFSNTQVVTGSDSKRSCSPAHLTNDESPSTAKPAAAMADSGVTLRRSASQRTSLSSASVKTMCTKLLDLQATRSSSAGLLATASGSRCSGGPVLAQTSAPDAVAVACCHGLEPSLAAQAPRVGRHYQTAGIVSASLQIFRSIS